MYDKIKTANENKSFFTLTDISQGFFGGRRSVTRQMTELGIITASMPSGGQGQPHLFTLPELFQVAAIKMLHEAGLTRLAASGISYGITTDDWQAMIGELLDGDQPAYHHANIGPGLEISIDPAVVAENVEKCLLQITNE